MKADKQQSESLIQKFQIGQSISMWTSFRNFVPILATREAISIIITEATANPSFAIGAAENTSGRPPCIVTKETNVARSHSTSATIAITGRRYDRTGFVTRKRIRIHAGVNKRLEP
ncbi:hypothetical protein HN011_011337 [Eciton burchellii]|nr:hypothetical protein HN011_011337 [Eciton burchellii]